MRLAQAPLHAPRRRCSTVQLASCVDALVSSLLTPHAVPQVFAALLQVYCTLFVPSQSSKMSRAP